MQAIVEDEEYKVIIMSDMAVCFKKIYENGQLVNLKKQGELWLDEDVDFEDKDSLIHLANASLFLVFGFKNKHVFNNPTITSK